MSFIGMDVRAVRQISSGLGVQANHVASITSTVEGLVGQSMQLWQGPDAVDFAHVWHSSHRPMLEQLRQVLEEMATAAQVNADQQELASGSVDGSAGGAGPSAGGGRPASRPWWEQPLEIDGISGAFGWAGLLGAVAETAFGPGSYKKGLFGKVWPVFDDGPKAFQRLGSFMKFAGAGLALNDIREGLAGGDQDVTILGVVNFAGAWAPPPLGLGIGVLDGFVKGTIPVGGDSQQSLLDYQSNRMFGLPSTQLSPDQSAQLMARYDGGFIGAAYMISDKMDQTWDEGPGEWLGQP